MAHETALGLKLSSKPTNSSQVIFSMGFLVVDDARAELANNVTATTATFIGFEFITASLVDFLFVFLPSIKLSRLYERNVCAEGQSTYFFRISRRHLRIDEELGTPNRSDRVDDWCQREVSCQLVGTRDANQSY